MRYRAELRAAYVAAPDLARGIPGLIAGGVAVLPLNDSGVIALATLAPFAVLLVLTLIAVAPPTPADGARTVNWLERTYELTRRQALALVAILGVATAASLVAARACARRERHARRARLRRDGAPAHRAGVYGYYSTCPTRSQPPATRCS